MIAGGEEAGGRRVFGRPVGPASPSIPGGGAGDVVATSALDFADLLGDRASEPVTAISSLRSAATAGGGGGGGGGGAASTVVTGLGEFELARASRVGGFVIGLLLLLADDLGGKLGQSRRAAAQWLGRARRSRGANRDSHTNRRCSGSAQQNEPSHRTLP